MENSKLFQVTANGYSCAQVDEYLKVLREEYKKVFDYARSLEASMAKSNEKAARLAVENRDMAEKLSAFEQQVGALEETVEHLKSTPAARPAAPVKAEDSTAEDNSIILRSISTMTLLSEEIVRENRELRRRIEALEQRQ